MSNETRKQIIKSIVYGMTAESIAEIYGIDIDTVGKIMVDNADDIEKEKRYRKELEGLA